MNDTETLMQFREMYDTVTAATARLVRPWKIASAVLAVLALGEALVIKRRRG